MTTFGNNGFRLDSGRAICVDCGILGIDSNGVLCEGYSGFVENAERFTPDERAEIAAYMVNLWIEWGTKEQEDE